VNSLPPFTDDGLLPPGDYVLTIEDLLTSSLVAGPAGAKSWNTKWRQKLVENLAVMVGHLITVGITEVYVDGSFVEEKDVPNDIDGYFACDANRWANGDLARDLRRLDSIWSWDAVQRKSFRKYPKDQLPMWHKHRVELFPNYGQFCGLFDGQGNKLTFSQAFRVVQRLFAQGDREDRRFVMIRTEFEYRETLKRIEQSERAFDDEEAQLKAQGLKAGQIKRMQAPSRAFHAQIKSEVETYKRLRNREKIT
jgi:hypothetical protein